ncbi:DUF6457 domain-containing protein [Tersicoccus sp. MR15.9]|uniref:DUF6457 domain-containing protein n=1 Tax=Tersicoccus mangrovi TaxID=3121635 RepID=UPI002FE5BC95
MSEKDDILQDWARRLAEQLGVPLEQVPVDDILGLAGVAAHQVIRPAAPLTTYIVGFAAGLAAANGGSGRPGTEMDVYADAARRLADTVAAERAAADATPAEHAPSDPVTDPAGGAASDPVTDPAGGAASGRPGDGGTGQDATRPAPGEPAP